MRTPSINSHPSSLLRVSELSIPAIETRKLCPCKKAGFDDKLELIVGSTPTCHLEAVTHNFVPLPGSLKAVGLVRGSNRRSNQPPPLNMLDNEVMVAGG